ncbi:MAG: caspase family protein [Candidatus Limnocylindria bacterium]
MTLLLKRSHKPATHAIVIGIGRYDWLVNGKKPTFAQNDGMAQLTSPPESARAFASWLLDIYDNPDAPLATLDLLISDSTGRFKVGAKDIAVQAATFANVAEAIRAWGKRGARKDDLLVFFFSGHGISAGDQTTLLCEDYGSDDISPLRHAIDFRKLRIAMDRFAARRQCFFVDACRVATSNILETFDYYGQPVIDPLSAHSPQPRQAPVFHSALAGQQAYGRKRRPSYFTEALLRAFDGAATDDARDGRWWVQTSVLLKALQPVLQRVVKEPQQVATAEDLSDFPLHRLKERPRNIPVDVWCEPRERTATAVLSYSGTKTKKTRTTRSPEAWELDLTEGRYTFKAKLTAPAAIRALDDEQIRPPNRTIRIPV